MIRANLYTNQKQVTIILDKQSNALIPFTTPQLDLLSRLFEIELYQAGDENLIGYMPDNSPAILFYARPIATSLNVYAVIKLWPPQLNHRVYVALEEGDIAYNAPVIVGDPPKGDGQITAIFMNAMEVPEYLTLGTFHLKDTLTMLRLVEVIKRSTNATTNVVSTISRSANFARSFGSKVTPVEIINILNDIR